MKHVSVSVEIIVYAELIIPGILALVFVSIASIQKALPVIQ